MGRSDWYKKWQMDRSFIIENDRLKKKTYIYAPFPRMNIYGFQNCDIRKVILGDVLARYERMKDNNVLFPVGFHSLGYSSFIESKKNSNVLNDDIPNIFYNQMLELGIGINENKLIDMKHDEYVSNLQLAFIDMYDKKYISYKDMRVYIDKVNNKIYDYLSKPNDDMHMQTQRCFVLEIGNIIPQIISDINKLDIDTKYKNRLIEGLNPKNVMKLDLRLTNGNTLPIEMDNPEYLGGISYIFLNPEYIDITSYTSIDEYYSVMEYLETGTTPFVYSGVNAINPLTGNNIPVFISTVYNMKSYLGIPAIDEEAFAIAKENGLEIIKIIDDNGLLINSDLLDGLLPAEARKTIFNAFIDADIAVSEVVYSNAEINLSSFDGFGPLFPFLYEKEKGTLNSLKDYLPYSFSSQFRPVLSSNVDIPGEIMNGTINNLFVEGMSPIISILFDSISVNESIFSEEAKEEYNKWTTVDCLIVEDEYLYSQLLMPIIFHNIIKKEVGYNIPNLFKKVLIVNKTVDISEKDIKRANNNLVNFDDYLNNYYADSLRYFSLFAPLEDEFIFDKYKLLDIDEFIKRIERTILSLDNDNNPRLDYHFYTFVNQCKNHLDNKNVLGYIKKIEAFVEEFIFKDIPSKDQLLIFLRVVYPLCPYLAEELYEKIFNGKHSIVNTGWPE